MTKNKLSTIGITMGDPSGIGPEIILKCFEKEDVRDKRLIVIGDFSVMTSACKMLKIKSFELNKINSIQECRFDRSTLNIIDLQLIDIDMLIPGEVQAASGNAAFQYIKRAIELALDNQISAIATAPLNKEALHLAGHKYPGHTEILASLTGTKDYAMLLHDKKLSVIHVSTHQSLLDAITGLRRERIEKVIDLANDSMKKLNIENPRIAVAGINPHAGENGLFGKEEIDMIAPAIKAARTKGVNASGPHAPDTVFLNALNGLFDIVVAMYHDQGHIPLKVVGFNWNEEKQKWDSISGVNITLGLPIIRSSVDHGTAFGKAGKGTASELSLVHAIEYAVKMTRN